MLHLAVADWDQNSARAFWPRPAHRNQRADALPTRRASMCINTQAVINTTFTEQQPPPK